MSASVAERRWWLAVRLMAGATVWSAGLLLAAVLVPAYDGERVSALTGITLTRETLVQRHGGWALALVLAPLLACATVAAAVALRRRSDASWSAPLAWSAAGALAIVALLGITSVGAFMLPVAAALGLGVRLAPGWADVRTAPPLRPAGAGGGAPAAAAAGAGARAGAGAGAREDGRPGRLATGA